MAARILSAQELSETYSVPLTTLRDYQAKGFLHPIHAGSATLYTERDCIRLELVLKGRKLGFSLCELKKIIDATAAEK